MAGPGYDEDGSLCSCYGGWSVDENWSPEYPELWKGERSPGDGLTPCGFCNFGDWNAPWPPDAQTGVRMPPAHWVGES